MPWGVRNIGRDKHKGRSRSAYTNQIMLLRLFISAPLDLGGQLGYRSLGVLESEVYR